MPRAVPPRRAGGPRILMTLDAVGGVWRYALDLAAGLGQHGIRCAFLGFGPEPGGEARAEAEALGPLDWSDCPPDWLAPDPAALAQVPGAIADAARRQRADLIHLNLPSQAAALKVPVPVVSVVHSCLPTWFAAVRGGGVPAQYAWHLGLNAQGMANSDCVLAPSRSLAAQIARVYGTSRLSRVRVVHNASRAPERQTADTPFVLAIGRWWDEGKNGAVLDAAAPMLDWPLLMVGAAEGPNGAVLPIAHAQHRGPLSHPMTQELIGRAGIFVAPSLYEPFGLAVVEAARAAVPLVLADIPTFRELWDGAALFFPPRDAQALAEVLRRLQADPDERRRLGRAAQTRAARHAPGPQLRAMLTLYSGLLAPAAPPLLANGAR
ncbi:MAG: glycosyltransferase family 4 protein [Defluviimonas sp.]|nr:glycosyltransferase family 4 protein [Defluviimonas sp.]